MDPNSTNSVNNQPLSPSASGMPAMNSNGQKKVGPIVATLVIVLILIIAALYVFASRINQQSVPTDNTSAATVDTSSQTAAVEPTVQPVTGTADDPASLQKDLNTSTQGVDAQNF